MFVESSHLRCCQSKPCAAYLGSLAKVSEQIKLNSLAQLKRLFGPPVLFVCVSLWWRVDLAMFVQVFEWFCPSGSRSPAHESLEFPMFFCWLFLATQQNSQVGDGFEAPGGMSEVPLVPKRWFWQGLGVHAHIRIVSFYYSYSAPT